MADRHIVESFQEQNSKTEKKEDIILHWRCNCIKYFLCIYLVHYINVLERYLTKNRKYHQKMTFFPDIADIILVYECQFCVK